jgi:hypothetical protein
MTLKGFLQHFKIPLISFLLLVLVLVYYSLDPTEYSIFPKCPFYWLTGYKCPGCGSQRAVHYLLHLDFRGAFYANPLLVMAIPYIIGAFLFDYTNLSNTFPRIRKVLYGKIAIIIVVIIVIAYWFIRNLYL